MDNFVAQALGCVDFWIWN